MGILPTRPAAVPAAEGSCTAKMAVRPACGRQAHRRDADATGLRSAAQALSTSRRRLAACLDDRYPAPSRASQTGREDGLSRRIGKALRRRAPAGDRETPLAYRCSDRMKCAVAVACVSLWCIAATGLPGCAARQRGRVAGTPAAFSRVIYGRFSSSWKAYTSTDSEVIDRIWSAVSADMSVAHPEPGAHEAMVIDQVVWFQAKKKHADRVYLVRGTKIYESEAKEDGHTARATPKAAQAEIRSGMLMPDDGDLAEHIPRLVANFEAADEPDVTWPGFPEYPPPEPGIGSERR